MFLLSKKPTKYGHALVGERRTRIMRSLVKIYIPYNDNIVEKFLLSKQLFNTFFHNTCLSMIGGIWSYFGGKWSYLCDHIPPTNDHIPPTNDHFPPTNDHFPPYRELERSIIENFIDNFNGKFKNEK